MSQAATSDGYLLTQDKNPMHNALFKSAMLASLALLPLAAPGCHGHRVDPYKDTNSELDDSRILPCSLLEFSSQAGKMIAQNIATAKDISSTPGEVTVILGSIRNLTTSVSTSEFEIVTHRVQNALINNNVAGTQVVDCRCHGLAPKL